MASNSKRKLSTNANVIEALAQTKKFKKSAIQDDLLIGHNETHDDSHDDIKTIDGDEDNDEDSEEDDDDDIDNEPAKQISDLLKNIRAFGAHSVGGLASVLPILPGLHVTNFGLVPLPLTENQSESLIKVCQQAPFGLNEQTLVDKRVRDSFELDASEFEIRNPKWSTQLELLVDSIGQQLGCVGKNVEAKLYKLLLYKTGGHFLKHKDTEREKNMFGTLIVQLPSVYTGGELVVYNGRQQIIYDFGQKSGDSAYFMHYAAHYADLEHEILTVTSGCRLVLTYNLCWTHTKEAYPRNETLISNLAKCLSVYTRSNENANLALLLEHEYTIESFNSSGIKSLKGIDYARFRLLSDANSELADESKFSFYLTEVNLVTHVQLEEKFDRYKKRYRDYSDDDDNCSVLEEFDRGGEVKAWYDENGQHILKESKVEFDFFDAIIAPSSHLDEIDLNDSQVYDENMHVEKEGYMGKYNMDGI